VARQRAAARAPSGGDVRLGRDGRIGVTLAARWRLDRKIGSGGVATVFAGTDLREGRAVAVKVLHDDLADDHEVRRRFLREGVVVNRIDHPGVVHVDDAGTDGERTYLVMDLLVGKTLKETWEAAGETLPAHDVVRYLCRVLEIVAAAHAAGVVHRDLKACNIFVTEGGDLRLLDFGIARLRDPNKTDENATAAGSMLGTPACMPPEQALGKWDEVDERADVFALGATAFRMLTGKPIHEAKSLPELLMAVASKPARPIRSVSQSIAPPLASVIDRALAFDKTARWSSAAEMLAALREAAASHAPPFSGALSEHSTTERTAPAPRSAATHEWAQPLSIEPTTDRMEDAPDSAGPTVAIEAPVPSPLAGPTVLSPRARTILMPQKATLASANGELIAHESPSTVEGEEGSTRRIGAEVVGEVLEAIGQTKRSKAQSATAALVAATSGPRRAGTIPMPPPIDATLAPAADVATAPDAPRTVEMPRAAATELLAEPPRPAATELLAAHVTRKASVPPPAPATVLLDTPATPVAAGGGASFPPDDDDLGQPTRVQRSTASPRPGAAIERATASVVAPKAQSGSARWLVLVLLVAIGAVAGWLMFRARGG
jgi:serine/threonine protein kinase